MNDTREVIIMILPDPSELRLDDLMVVPTFNVERAAGAWCVASTFGADETGDLKVLRHFDTRAEARLFMEAAHVINKLRDRLEALTGAIDKDAWRDMLKSGPVDPAREARFRERMAARVAADNEASGSMLDSAVDAIMKGANARREVMTQADLAKFKSAITH